jgi:hypothetical protein
LAVWEVLNSSLFLLIIGFALTTIVGTYLTHLTQRNAWRRDTRVQLLRQRYDEGCKFLDELAELIGRRFFAAQRLLWAIENTKDYDLPKTAAEYYAIVSEWNTRLWENRNKIRLLVSEEQANAFLDYEDDNRGDAPRSLHYKFVILGRILKQARAGQTLPERAQPSVYRVNHACSNFLESLTTAFLRRATALELLEVTAAQEPTPRGMRHGPE